ncbi:MULTISPECIES: hypothetical protein [Gammaproteobacteria]|uniref:hypothetical protein n=1 Tax=Gammaproteobacteria TaxID=1236 RepID=UPI002FC93CA9
MSTTTKNGSKVERVVFITNTLTAFVWAYGAWRMWQKLKVDDSMFRKMERSPMTCGVVKATSHKAFIYMRISLDHVECRRYEFYGYRVWKNENVKKVKTSNIMRHLSLKGRAVVKLDARSGMRSITITKRPGGLFITGQFPDSRLAKVTEQEVMSMLDNNSIYIESWS